MNSRTFEASFEVIFKFSLKIVFTCDRFRMTRHSRNCTAGAFYSYAERKKDSEASGFGSANKRMSKDSVSFRLLFLENGDR